MCIFCFVWNQAVTSKQFSVLNVLKGLNASIDKENKYAKTALMLAAEHEATEAIAKLVQVRVRLAEIVVTEHFSLLHSAMYIQQKNSVITPKSTCLRA